MGCKYSPYPINMGCKHSPDFLNLGCKHSPDPIPTHHFPGSDETGWRSKD